MTGFESKRQAAQDKMELADAYALTVAATPHMPTPLERKLAVERIERARNALEAALEQQQDKLNDDAQVYIAEYEAALLVSFQWIAVVAAVFLIFAIIYVWIDL